MIGPIAALGVDLIGCQNLVMMMVTGIQQLIEGPSSPRPPKRDEQGTEEEIETITGHAYRSLPNTLIVMQPALKPTRLRML